MLIRFSVENAYCFYEKATLSMIADKDHETHPEHLIETPLESGHKLLKAAAIYGANGHGKSNFIKILDQLRNLVLGKRFYFPYFKLNSKAKEEPTKLVIEYILGDRAYEYGVTIKEGSKIIEEWLYDITESQDGEIIFHRAKDDKEKNKISYGEKIKFPDKDPSGKTNGRKYIEMIGNNIEETQSLSALFSNHKINILTWFRKFFERINIVDIGASLTNLIAFIRKNSEEVNKRLQEIYIGITSFKIKKEKKIFLESFVQNLFLREPNLDHIPFGGIGEYSRDEKGDIYYSSLVFKRKNEKGQEVDFSLEEESEGTQRFLNLLPLIIEEKDPSIFIIDELDRSLHPLLAKTLLLEVVKQKNRQVIFTTHQPYLMSTDLLRKDEIYLVQKRDEEGSSEVFSLLEIKTASDERYDDAYLEGLYGGIPILRGFGK